MAQPSDRAPHLPRSRLRGRALPVMPVMLGYAPPAEPPVPVLRTPGKARPFELMARVKDQLRNLTGYGVNSVSGFAKADVGWHLSVTVVELHRIPAVTDVLALYEVDLDEGGDIVGYHRARRYLRDETGEEP